MAEMRKRKSVMVVDADKLLELLPMIPYETPEIERLIGNLMDAVNESRVEIAEEERTQKELQIISWGK